MKILFTDLDDTLLNKESRVSEYSISVLRDFVRAGNILVPASGRPLLSVQECVKNAGIEDLVHYIVAYNGALIWNVKENVEAWSARLPRDYARIIQNTTLDMGIHFQTYANEHIYTPVDDEEIRQYRKKIHLPVEFVEDPVSRIGCDPYKALAIDIYDRTRLEKLQEAVTPLLGDNINSFFSNAALLEFVNKDASKGIALAELCKLLDIPIENSYAAGDQENDVSMIQAAGCGIGMLNAVEKVKAIADVITEYDYDHDGLAKFLLSVM